MSATTMPTVTLALLAEMDAVRDTYVDTQVSGVIAFREGDLSRAQVDDLLIEARMNWDRDHPEMAACMKRRGVVRRAESGVAS